MADDIMIFPDTWEEFEKQYGFYDSKQAYMYGNTRLIPSFRVEQWLDHMESVKHSQQAEDRIELTHLMGKKLDKPIIMKWKSETKKNKMAQVAALFGKIIGDYVYIRDGDKPKRRYLIIDSGLYRCDGVIGSKYECYIKYKPAPKMLMKLLVGKAVIVDD